MFGSTYDVSSFDGFGGYGHQGGGGGGGGYGFDTHIAHQVDAITGEYEELNVDEAVHTVRDELHRNSFDASLLIDDVMRDVTWENNVEEQLFIIFEGLSRDLALVANEMENEIVASKRKVKRADLALISDLDNHTDKLNQVRGAVDEIKTRFDQASEGAVRIGERLAASENERRRIEVGIELLNYISWFEKSPITNYSDLPSKTTQEIREVLPQNLQRKNFGEISQVINELRKVLLDINASDVQNAQKNVLRLSEVLEDKLLSEFESAVTDLMEDPGQLILAETCRNLIIWLQCYQSGAALHKRFIHCAVEKSIPRPASSAALEKVGSTSTSAWSKLSSGVKAIGTKIKDLGGNKENDMSGINDEEEEYYMDAQDSLSEHFGSIGRVCQQQFGLIRDIFPQHVVAKITRMLIQRIFTDSAFGIQSRVDAVLSPKPPLPQLSLSDYLDSLANVREKLSALYVILLEYCSHPALIGMGSEAALTRVTSAPSSNNNFTSANRSTKAVSFALDSAAAAAATSIALNAPGAMTTSDALLDEMNEKVKSDNEVKAFLQEQIMGVLSSYLVDYFDKEMAFLRAQYVEGLRRVVDDDKGTSKVSAGTVLQMPRLRAEKMKSIGSLVKTVANNYYVNNVVATTTDSVIRMENIGRDDKKLPARIKELYLLQLGFLIDGVFYPYVQACTTMLLRSAVAAPKNSVLPPLEYIQALATVYSGVTLLKKNFDDVFAPSMTSVPNLVVVCKEARRNSLKPLESAAKESMHAWTMCVILHMERTLAAMQDSDDFHPQGMRGQSEPSAACDVVCQSFMKVISTVQGYKSDLIGIDLVETLWKPLGQQFVGTLLSHLRRQKISQEGAATLMADLDEYQSIAQSMETPETKDMMLCLKEIASVFAAPPENVAKIVVENLRHLDTVIVLAIVRARADFTTRPSLSHWTKKISTSYGFSKWDHSFHWEKKKQVTVMSVIETAANTEPLGPTTLRKASLSWGELELVHHQQVVDGASKDEGDEGPDGQEGQSGTGMPTITGPASFAAAIQERFAALMPQEADGSRRKLFPGVMAPELRFTFGGGEDGEGLRVGEKIKEGFEDMGEGIRNAGEKVAGGFKSGFGAVKNAVTSIGRDKSPSRPHNDDEGDGGGDGGEDTPKPKVMVNPFKAIQVAAAVGAVGGAVTGAAGAVSGAFVRAVSPLRGGGGSGGEGNSSVGGGDGSTPDRNKMLERVRGVFARK